MNTENPASRRTFLTVAGAGLAAAGVAVLGPRLASDPAATDTAVSAAAQSVAALPKDVEHSVMAFVSNVHAGVVTVMVEGREVEITDHALVAKLVHAVRPTV